MLYSSIDWIRYTFKTTNLNTVLNILGFRREEFTLCNKGLYGYNTKLRHYLYNIFLLCDGRSDMGICLDVSGSAIDYLMLTVTSKYITEENRYKMFYDTLCDNGTMKRIDIAIDDIGSEFYSVEKFYKQLTLDKYVGKFTEYSIIRSTDVSTSQSGSTVYCGKRTSNTFLRVYDKQAETNHKNKNDDVKEKWVRYEIELKNETADIVFNRLKDEEFTHLSMNVLNSVIRLVNNDNERKTRCTTQRNWEKMVGSPVKIKLSYPKQTSYNKTETWIYQIVSRSIAKVLDANQQNPNYLTQIIEKGREKYSEADYQQIIKEINDDMAPFMPQPICYEEYMQNIAQ